MAADNTIIQPQHQTLLADSGILAEIAEVRGYRSVTAIAELRRLGFAETQCSVPTLLIPIWDVHGQVAMYQSRPDRPRILDGKPVKYETPRGSRMVLDVHPSIRKHLQDPGWRLLITEGVRKADSAVSRGLCCVALLGVWNWRGTNEYGGKVALSDWESIALNCREVFIVFDSDVMRKPQVHDALARLKEFLESRGAKVSLIYLPENEDGSKVGLDDFLAAGHDLPELMTHAASEIRPRPKDDDEQGHGAQYRIHDGCIQVLRGNVLFRYLAPLCNFTAMVIEEEERDDGVDASRSFVVSGTLKSGEPLPQARVPVDRFPSMSWVGQQWGLKAVVAAGQANKDQLREAIQLLSPKARYRRVFTHTGWRSIEGAWSYLTASGAVGREGLEVDLPQGLARYRLPELPIRAPDAMAASISLLEVAPIETTAALWSAVFRAPLAHALACDLSVWVEGLTGSLKSSIVAVYLSHWGHFDRTCLPGSWSSTANQLERAAFLLKDAMFVVDDYAPTALDRRELEMKASRLLRAQGNRSGRGRLRQDLTERPAYPPGGIIVSTGEDRPVGQSILARTFVVELERPQVRMDLLTAAQKVAVQLPNAMAGYVAWLAPQMDYLSTTLRETFVALRDKAHSGSAHLRVPEALAHLGLGLDCGLAYAVEIKACDQARADELRAQTWEALVKRAEEQGRLIEEERPTKRFLEVLAALLLQGKMLLLRKDAASAEGRSDAVLLGWKDHEFFYLQPQVAYQVVSRFARDAGEPFPVSRSRLMQDLLREKLSEPDPGRSTARLRVGGAQRRVLKLRRRAVTEVLGEELDSAGAVTDVTAFGG